METEMARSSTPLGVRRGGNEESYFRLRDAALVQKMRARLEQREAASAIAKHGEVDDPEIAAAFVGLGITLETLPIVHLVPLIAVAWADGEMQTLERDLLRKAAASRGLDGAAMELFKSMLKKAPSTELLDASIDYIKHVLAALPADQAERAHADFKNLSWRIADASGGFLGWIGRVEQEEREILQELSDRLVAIQPESAAKILEAL